MDFNGDYPGSRVKRLKVDTTAEIDGDTTIGGDLHVEGAIDIKEVKTDKIATLDGSVGAPSHTFQSDLKTGMWRDTTGDLSFSRNGVEVASFKSGQHAHMIKVRAEDYVATGSDGLRLTGVPEGLILSDSDLLLQSLSSTTKFKNEGADIAQLSTTEGHFIVPVRTDGKVTGDYYDFKDDTENTKIYRDSGDSKLKIQVSGDPSCEFYSKTIEGTYSIMNSMTTSSLTATTASITDVTCSTLSCDSQPYTEFSNSVVQFCTASITSALVVGTVPTVARGSPLVTTNGTVFTIPLSGYYHIEWTVVWLNGPGGSRKTYIQKLPSGPLLGYQTKSAVTVPLEGTTSEGQYTAYLTTGDQFSVFVFSSANNSIPTDPSIKTRVSFLRLY